MLSRRASNSYLLVGAGSVEDVFSVRCRDAAGWSNLPQQVNVGLLIFPSNCQTADGVPESVARFRLCTNLSVWAWSEVRTYLVRTTCRKQTGGGLFHLYAAKLNFPAQQIVFLIGANNESWRWIFYRKLFPSLKKVAIEKCLTSVRKPKVGCRSRKSHDNLSINCYVRWERQKVGTMRPLSGLSGGLCLDRSLVIRCQTSPDCYKWKNGVTEFTDPEMFRLELILIITNKEILCFDIT